MNMQDENYKGYEITEEQGLMFKAVRTAAGNLAVTGDILNAGTLEQLKAMIDHRTRPKNRPRVPKEKAF